MDLSVFISETLVQIQHGVREAQTRLQKIGKDTGPPIGVVNPAWEDAEIGGAENTTSVAFDVAVMATEKKTGGGGASLQVAGVGIKGEGAKTVEGGSVSRVQFSVPFILPIQKVRK